MFHPPSPTKTIIILVSVSFKHIVILFLMTAELIIVSKKRSGCHRCAIRLTIDRGGGGGVIFSIFGYSTFFFKAFIKLHSRVK